MTPLPFLRHDMRMTDAKKIPVTILTGFLGAGKTTLLNHILTTDTDTKYAVVINEFGQAGIDDKLVTAQLDEEIFEMNNGCICCTVRGDLIRIINVLMKKREKFDHILVETTGLADPAPVAQTFFADQDVKAAAELDSILTVVDAAHIINQLKESREAVDQIAFADTILINKVDAVTDGGAAAEAAVRHINPSAHVVRGRCAEVPLRGLLHRGAFNLERMLELDPQFVDTAAEGGAHTHTEGVSSVSLTAGELDGRKFDTWMSGLLQEHGGDMLRTKGILAIQDESRRYVFQAVHMMSDVALTSPWGEAKRGSTLVMIGRNLNGPALRAAFRACEA